MHSHLKPESIAQSRFGNIVHKSARFLAQVCVAIATTQVLAGDVIMPSDKLPKPMQWDLTKLSEPPAFQWKDAKSPVRSLYYEGESYQGHPTRVFAYFASPKTLGVAGTK